MKLTYIFVLLLTLSIANAAIVTVTMQTAYNNLPQRMFNNLPSKTGSQGLLPYYSVYNGSATYDTINLNGTAYFDIYDFSGVKRASGIPIAINLSSDSLNTINAKLSAAEWKQFVNDSGTLNNAFLYVLASYYNYNDQVCREP